MFKETLIFVLLSFLKLFRSKGLGLEILIFVLLSVLKLFRSKGLNFNFPFKKGTGIERLLTHVSPEAIQLIYLMCTYDPDERITAHQALKHTYFRTLR